MAEIEKEVLGIVVLGMLFSFQAEAFTYDVEFTASDLLNPFEFLAPGPDIEVVGSFTLEFDSPGRPAIGQLIQRVDAIVLDLDLEIDGVGYSSDEVAAGVVFRRREIQSLDLRSLGLAGCRANQFSTSFCVGGLGDSGHFSFSNAGENGYFIPGRLDFSASERVMPAVPEPSSALVFVIGLGVFSIARRREAAELASRRVTGRH